MSLATPEKIRTLQRKLYRKAKAEPAFRFYLLYDKICRNDILEHAYALARTNGGAPGVDGESFAAIEAAGRGGAGGPPAPRRPGTAWCKPPASWCWSRSSRRISTLRPMAIGRGGAGPTRSRRCMPCCAEASPVLGAAIFR